MSPEAAAVVNEVPPHPAVRLLSSWGLREGTGSADWKITRVIVRDESGEVVIAFARGGDSIDVHVRPASDNPRFTRVGALDLSHGRVDAQLARPAEILVGSMGAWLARHDSGADLARLLSVAPAAAPTPRIQSELPAVPTPAQADPDSAAYLAVAEPPPLDPAKRASAARPFMKFETIGLDDLGRYRDALREMYAGSLGGLVIRGVYSPEDMARVTATLEGGRSERTLNYPRTSFPPQWNAHFFGRSLDGSDPALQKYLADAALFREQTLAVFASTSPYEARIEEIFRALSGGREVGVPRYLDGRCYTPSTIRFLLEGGQIGTHCGNEASGRPAYTHLNSLIDRGDQISFFLTLQAAEAGGELIVYSLKWSDIDPALMTEGRTNSLFQSPQNPLLQAEWLAVSPGPGDLLIFDGGRYFHRVAKVQGPRTRWTIGGFMMFDKAAESIFYWS